MLTGKAAMSALRKAPGLARVLKEHIDQHGYTEPLVLSGLGVLAVIVGTKMIIVGKVLALGGGVATMAALALLQPQIALFCALAATLGLAVVLLGYVLMAGGMIAASVGTAWLLTKCLWRLGCRHSENGALVPA